MLFATLFVRSFAMLEAEKHITSAMLFLDIKSAFHSMLGEFTFGSDISKSATLIQVLQRAGCDVAAIQETMLQNRDLFMSHLTPSTARLLADTHTHSHLVHVGFNI